MIEFCRINNLCLLNGRIGRYTHNTEYTCTCKDKSAVDYFLCTPSLFCTLSDFSVLQFSSLFSDAHCPVSLLLRTQNLAENENDIVLPEYDIRLWKHEKSQSFQDNFNLDSLREIDSKLSFLTKRGSLQQEEIDEIVMQIGQNFERCAEASFGRIKRPSVKHENDTANKPWFNVNCKRARNDYHKARRKYNANKSEQNKQILRQTSKFYKTRWILALNNLKTCEYRNLKT